MRLRASLLGLLLLASPAAAQTAKPGVPEPDRATLLKRAAVAVSAGRRAEAATLLREAADRFQSVRALLQLAELQSNGGDSKGALDSLTRARTLAPNAEGVLAALARRLGKSPLPALQAWEPLARMHPKVAEYQLGLGTALADAGDLRAAVAALKRSQALEPNRASTLVALGIALNGLGAYAEAREPLTRSLELEPDNTDAAAALAEAEVGVGDLASAEAHAWRALTRSPAHATANLALGMVLLSRDRPAEAREALQTAAAADPRSAKAEHQLALVCTALNDGDGARIHEAESRRRADEARARVERLWETLGRFDGDEP